MKAPTHPSAPRFLSLVCALTVATGSVRIANAQPATPFPAAALAAGPGLPSIENLTTALNLTTAQIATIKPILADLDVASKNLTKLQETVTGLTNKLSPILTVAQRPQLTAVLTPARGARGGQTQTGPSAPVPPQVAIPRPTPAELAQINTTLDAFSASNPLLKKYPAIITVTPPRAVNVAATYTATGVRNPRHQAFVDIAKKGDIDLLFDGDSITDFWRNSGRAGVENPPMAGKAVFDKYFGSLKAANFAVSGDMTQGVLWGLQNGEGQGFSPKAIMLMIGTNNTAANTGPEIAEGVGAIVQEMRKDFPNAKILLLAIFPRGTGPTDANRLKNEEANKIIARLHDGQHVFFMDIGSKFLSPDGTIARDIMSDQLHPTEKGYEIWAVAVKDKLSELMK